MYSVQSYCDSQSCMHMVLNTNWANPVVGLNFFLLLLITPERVVDRRESINTSVHDDVAKVFKGKTYSQLIALEKQIHQKITSGDAVDIGKKLRIKQT